MDRGLPQTNASLTCIISAEAPDRLDDSSGSSSAGDVLIRSTGIQSRTRGGGRTWETSAMSHEHIRVCVKKLREAPWPSAEPGAGTPREPCTPPALPANRPPAPAAAATTGGLRDTALGGKEESCDLRGGVRQPFSGPGNNLDCQIPPKNRKKMQVFTAPPEGSSNKGHDVLISQYSASDKEAARAFFRQRSQSAPLRREVRVQLLDEQGTSATASHHPDATPAPTPAPTPVGDPATAAAVAAAAVAATVPLLKVGTGRRGRDGH
ncbi:protein TALPID3 [Amia ocellicauda]|uniref:protein TALPID3 n=1 Tax=Amia ocellicauda TaxID=2972642 RepID=UPI00346478C5